MKRWIPRRSVFLEDFAKEMLHDTVFAERLFSDHGKKGRYWMLLVVKNRGAVRKAEQQLAHSNHKRVTVGFCHELEVQPSSGRRLKLLGFVVVSVTDLTYGVVTHELVHAAHFALLHSREHRHKLLDDDSIAEPLAWVAGWYAAQFWTAWEEWVSDARS